MSLALVIPPAAGCVREEVGGTEGGLVAVGGDMLARTGGLEAC